MFWGVTWPFAPRMKLRGRALVWMVCALVRFLPWTPGAHAVAVQALHAHRQRAVRERPMRTSDGAQLPGRRRVGQSYY